MAVRLQFGPHPVVPDLDIPAAALTAALTATPDNLTDQDAAEAFIRSLTALGVPLVPVDPHEKAKKPLWGMKFSDATTDEDTWAAWLPRAAETGTDSGESWGLGAMVGSIGNDVALVGLDDDKPAEHPGRRAALKAWGMDPDTPPTVSTPGTTDREHCDGGHWWFIVPDYLVNGDLMKKPLTIDAEGRVDPLGATPTAALFTGNRQILIPPTRREAGQYRVAGEVHAATPEMITWLTEQRQRRAKEAIDRAAAAEEREARLAAGEDTAREAAVEAFEDDCSWTDLLTEAGWEESTRVASCGCPMWNRPGYSSNGSAVAHENCGQFGDVLHANTTALDWTNLNKMQFRERELGVPMSQTLTEYGAPAGAQPNPLLDLGARVRKIAANGNLPAISTTMASGTAETATTPSLAAQLVAATACRADVAASIIALVGDDGVRSDWDALTALGATGLEALARLRGKEAADDYAAGTGSVITLDDVAPDDAELDDLYDAQAPEPVHGGLFYRQGLHLLCAPGATGKTWLTLNAAIPLEPFKWEENAAHPRPYGVYIDADGNGRASLLARAAQLGCERDRVAAGDLHVLSLPDVAAKRHCGQREALAGILAGLAAAHNLPDVVVIDSLTQLLAMADGDSNSDVTVTAALRQFRALSERTCVVVIDHVGLTDTDRPRGSSAKRDAVDVVLMMSPLDPDPENHPDTEMSARLSISKDRHNGITAALCAPNNPKVLGTWVLKRTGGVVSVGKRKPRQLDRLSSEIISAKASADKREREEQQAAAAVPNKVAAAIQAAPDSEVVGSRALTALLTTEGMSKNAAEKAVKAAKAAGAISTTRRGRTTVYTPA